MREIQEGMLPCPFCGSEDCSSSQGKAFARDQWYVECEHCGASGSWHQFKGEAVAAWNARAGAAPVERGGRERLIEIVHAIQRQSADATSSGRAFDMDSSEEWADRILAAAPREQEPQGVAYRQAREAFDHSEGALVKLTGTELPAPGETREMVGVGDIASIIESCMGAWHNRRVDRATWDESKNEAARIIFELLHPQNAVPTGEAARLVEIERVVFPAIIEGVQRRMAVHCGEISGPVQYSDIARRAAARLLRTLAPQGGTGEAPDTHEEGIRNARLLMNTVKISGPPSVVAHFRKHVELAFAAAIHADQEIQEGARLLLSVACSIADAAPWRQSPDMDALKSAAAAYRQECQHGPESLCHVCDPDGRQAAAWSDPQRPPGLPKLRHCQECGEAIPQVPGPPDPPPYFCAKHRHLIPPHPGVA